jgi:hypothetical protein
LTKPARFGAKFELHRANIDLVPIAELDRLLHARAIAVGAISAPKVNQPKFSLVLSMNQGVTSGYFLACNNDSVLRPPPYAAGIAEG